VRAGRVSVVGVLSVCRKLWSWRWFSEDVVSKQVGSTWTTAGAIAAFGSHSQQPIACICRSAKTESCCCFRTSSSFFALLVAAAVLYNSPCNCRC
jgi:hypothetical protein